MPRDAEIPKLEPRSKAQLEAIRAEAVAKIELLLEDGPKTAIQMFDEVGGLYQTMLGYLRYMHKTRRSVRPTGEKRKRACLWELGADPSVPDLDVAKHGTAPAQQIGMHRDYLVAAFFGPATQ